MSCRFSDRNSKIFLQILSYPCITILQFFLTTFKTRPLTNTIKVAVVVIRHLVYIDTQGIDWTRQLKSNWQPMPDLCGNTGTEHHVQARFKHEYEHRKRTQTILITASENMRQIVGFRTTFEANLKNWTV